MKATIPLRDRFWNLVLGGDPRDCWEWIGGMLAHGYGIYGGTTAHRVAYELAIGPIPVGLTIDHLCRNRGCVNPLHMEAVTRRENILRGTGFAAKNAKKSACPHGHAYDARNTHFDYRGGRSCRMCGRLKARLKRGPFRQRIGLRDGDMEIIRSLYVGRWKPKMTVVARAFGISLSHAYGVSKSERRAHARLLNP